MKKNITQKMITDFRSFLFEDEKSNNTIEKYMHDIMVFSAFANGLEINKDLVIKYKSNLIEKYTVASANSMIAALNAFLNFTGWTDCCIKQFKVQKKVFCSEEKELTKSEYVRLVNAAKQKCNERLNLIMQTICGTGIRVSELKFITVEAVRKGEATVSCKNKTRTIFIIRDLQKKLLKYIRAKSIVSGCVFITKSGKPIDRSNIWKEMKSICKHAGVSDNKVFPHNLRHLFARAFYSIDKDIAKLADILGHSSINTTRIYIITTGAEHKQKIEKLHLII